MPLENLYKREKPTVKKKLKGWSIVRRDRRCATHAPKQTTQTLHRLPLTPSPPPPPTPQKTEAGAAPTRSRGISRISWPYFMNTVPAVCAGLIPVPSLVVAAMESTEAIPNSSAAKRSTAVRGASSAILITRNGWLRSEVRMTRKVTLLPLGDAEPPV
ncbi:hypothetical protein, conserved [Leishmania tarentolae]|uniref:Uncharacterized protein n=1 Tax=Leishmania tarentolae TaxID=5689 RepID=A0A640KEE3_LEITA|nr:hypothetical protein, conserved [Leishmania tarentolae]